MLQCSKDDILASGFGASGVILSDGCDGKNLVASNRSINFDVGTPSINPVHSPHHLALDFFPLCLDLDNLEGICITGRTRILVKRQQT